MRSRTRDLAAWILATVGLAAVSASLEAGINSWTESAPGEIPNGAARFIAADPHDPYLVYAVFERSLYRSPDGGATWSRLVTYDQIDAFLVHPANPSLLFLATPGDESNPSNSGIVRSTDAGLTWANSLFLSPVTALAGSPTDPGIVYAGSPVWGTVSVTTDGGEHWTEGSILGAISALAVPPDAPETVYAGTEFDFYYFSFVGFGASPDGGVTWESLIESGFSVRALAVDPEDPAQLYMGRGDDPATAEPDTVWKSEDAGVTWFRSSTGLPAFGTVRGLAIDPNHPQILYAATWDGVYRSRDSGVTWTAFSAGIDGLDVESLSISQNGRVLYGATAQGAFQIQLARGPVDVAAGDAGSSRVLSWGADRLVVQTLDGSGHWHAAPESDPSSTWIATAISSDATRDFLLWQNGDSRSALEVVGPTGQESTTVFPSSFGMPTDVAAISGGGARLLVRTSAGATSLVRVDAAGHETAGPAYGPTTGWTALALAETGGDHTAVLWRSADGRSAVSFHSDGAMTTTWRFAAVPGWTVQDIAAAPDGNLRILARTTSGTMQIWTIDAAGFRSFSAVQETPGLAPQRISVGADGNTRVLWSDLDGSGSVWILDPHGTPLSESDVPEGPLPGGIAGEWFGTFSSVDFLDCELSVSASATFTQQGSAVEGTLNAEERGCGASDVAFHGTLNGNQIQGTIIGGSGRYQFTAGSTATGVLSGTTLVLDLTQPSQFPLPVQSGRMELHR